MTAVEGTIFPRQERTGGSLVPSDGALGWTLSLSGEGGRLPPTVAAAPRGQTATVFGPRLPKGRGQTSDCPVASGAAVCPDRHLMKALGEEQYKHQRPLFPLRFHLCSFLPSPWMPSCALTSLGAVPSTRQVGPCATAGRRQSSTVPGKYREGLPLSPAVGSADGICQPPHPNPVLQTWTQGAWSQDMLGLPRANSCPLAHGLGWLQRPAAEPGKMTSLEQDSTSPGSPSVNGQWAVTQVCVPGKSIKSLGIPRPGHKSQGPLGDTPWLWVNTGAIIIIITPMGTSPLVRNSLPKELWTHPQQVPIPPPACPPAPSRKCLSLRLCP